MQDARGTRPSEFSREGLSIETANQSWLVLGSLSLGLLVYLAMAVALVRWTHPRVISPAAFLPELRRFVRPEPMERMLYLVGLISIPTLPTLFYGLLACWGRRYPRLGRCLANPYGLTVRDGLVVGGVLLWLGFLAQRSQIPAASSYLAGACLLSVLAPLATICTFAGRPWTVRIAAVGVILSAWTLLLREQSEIGGRLDSTYHFDLLLGAVNQVMHGRTILVDATSQYGILYPYVAAIAVAPFGLSATHLSLFFVGLSLPALALVYAIYARKMGSGSPGALVCLLATLAVFHPFWGSALFDFAPCVVYYQYFPLRVICGVFFLWFSGLYFQQPSRRLMLAGYLAAGASLLWNADTGMVVLVAWTASLLVDAVGQRPEMAIPVPGARDESVGNVLRGAPDAGVGSSCSSRNATEGVPYSVLSRPSLAIAARIAGHLAMLVLTLVVSAAGYALFARIRSGRLPDLKAFWQYQEIYYTAGYFMLPMKRCELWQPIVLLYLVVVAGGVRRALQGTADAGSKWNLFVALYGLGVFSYYQGRSHVFCLAAVLYPAMILACLLSADMAAAWRAAGCSLKTPEARFLWLKLAGCWLLVGFGLIHFGRGLPLAVAHLARGRPREASLYHESAIGLLRQRLEGSATVILSPLSNYLHVQTHSWSALPFSSPAEIVLLAQAREARQALDGRRKLYLVDDPRGGGILLRYVRPDRLQEVQRIEGLTLYAREATIPGQTISRPSRPPP